MIQTGFECVAIAATSDTNFASTVWLDNIGTDTEYREEALTVEEYTGLPYHLQTEHTLEIVTHDNPTKQSQLKAWAEANTSVYIWLYGIRGSVVWGVASRITFERTTGGDPGNHSEFIIRTKYRVVGANIRNSLNLLPPTFRTGDYATSNLTATSCTVASTTPNVSFTTASGNIYKLTQTVAGGYTAVLGTSMFDRFPARSGMSFYLRGAAYTSAGNDPQAELQLKNYGSSGSLLSTQFISGIGGTVLESIADDLTISNASTTYVRFGLAGSTSSGTTGVNEFDSLQLTYGSNTEAYYNG